MFTNLSSQRSDGLWSGCISTQLLLAACCISKQKHSQAPYYFLCWWENKFYDILRFWASASVNEICILLGIYTAHTASCSRFRTTYQSNFQGSSSTTRISTQDCLTLRLIGCPATSGTNCQSTVRTIPEEYISHPTLRFSTPLLNEDFVCVCVCVCVYTHTHA